MAPSSLFFFLSFQRDGPLDMRMNIGEFLTEDDYYYDTEYFNVTFGYI